jgi:hypothetical protein
LDRALPAGPEFGRWPRVSSYVFFAGSTALNAPLAFCVASLWAKFLKKMVSVSG